MTHGDAVDVVDFGLSLLNEDELIAQFHHARLFTDEEIVERRPPRQWEYLKDGLVENVKDRLIRVDGVIQRGVRAYDMDAGWVRKLARQSDGALTIVRNGLVEDTITGTVEIE